MQNCGNKNNTIKDNHCLNIHVASYNGGVTYDCASIAKCGPFSP